MTHRLKLILSLTLVVATLAAGCSDSGSSATTSDPDGASAPETLVQAVIDRLRETRSVSVETLEGIDENVHFKLPQVLADVRPAQGGMASMGGE